MVTWQRMPNHEEDDGKAKNVGCNWLSGGKRVRSQSTRVAVPEHGNDKAGVLFSRAVALRLIGCNPGAWHERFCVKIQILSSEYLTWLRAETLLLSWSERWR
ncbi:hypothetical protein TNCT_87961 [Trichonephila clavata]|uniref:Uncharacterized protein n=1 Tax=Trichonephila clavata TaxID=2740835 RepID=A0A8X6FBH6_TRICU|nr:hypothetical protein TNCT_87961 [Trichonephila clavata]